MADAEGLASDFASEELSTLPPIRRSASVVTAIGTLAPDRLREPFAGQLKASGGVPVRYYRSRGQLESLRLDRAWAMCMVLSPHKSGAQRICHVISAVATDAGAVDTLIRDDRHRIAGLNTNVYAAAAALALMAGPSDSQRCVILGTGATARAVALALRSRFRGWNVSVWGRDRDRAGEVARRYGLKTATVLAARRWDVIINCTTLGETAKGDYGADAIPELRPVLQRGVLFWDLNSRVSQLQTVALEAGCLVSSGVVMQEFVDQLRAHLFCSSAPGPI